MSDALVTAKDLTIAFATPSGLHPAVSGASLSIQRGEVLALVGESGSGKSTFVSAMMALPAPQARLSGRLRFQGRDLVAMPEAERRMLRGNGIAAIFQDPFTALNPVVSIGTTLTEVQHHKRERGRREKRARAIAMLARVGISDAERRMRQFPFELSGGMRQRVAIAAALLTDPVLLIADEPTTALDATTEAQIVDLLRNSRADLDGAMVFVTHHLQLVSELCDRAAVMYAGRIVELAPVMQLFTGPRHPYTRALIDCDPALITERSRHLPTIPGSVPSPGAMGQGCAFATRCTQADALCHTMPPPMVADAGGAQVLCHRPLS